MTTGNDFHHPQTLEKRIDELSTDLGIMQEVIDFAQLRIPTDDQKKSREIVRVRCCWGENARKKDHHCPADGLASHFCTPSTHPAKLVDMVRRGRAQGKVVGVGDFFKWFCTDQSGSDHMQKVCEAHLAAQRKAGKAEEDLDHLRIHSLNRTASMITSKGTEFLEEWKKELKAAKAALEFEDRHEAEDELDFLGYVYGGEEEDQPLPVDVVEDPHEEPATTSLGGHFSQVAAAAAGGN